MKLKDAGYSGSLQDTLNLTACLPCVWKACYQADISSLGFTRVPPNLGSDCCPFDSTIQMDR